MQRLMNKVGTFVLSGIVAASCGSNNTNVFDAPVIFSKPHEVCAIEGKKVAFSDYKPIGIVSLYVEDSILLVKAGDPKTSPFQFHAFSLKDLSDKGHFIAKGRGENEMLKPIIRGSVNGWQDGVYLFDLGLCSSYCLDLTKSMEMQKTNLRQISKLPARTIDVYPMGNHQLAFVLEKDDYACVELDMEGNRVSSIPLYPEVSGNQYFDRLSSACALNLERQKLAMAMCMLPQLNMLDVSTGRRKTFAVSKEYRDWEKMLKSDDDARWMHYISVAQSSECIMALYGGCSLMDWLTSAVLPHLHIFDWDGNFLYDVSIKENLNAIAFDESNRRLLGVDKDDEIFEYDLSGLKL